MLVRSSDGFTTTQFLILMVSSARFFETGMCTPTATARTLVGSNTAGCGTRTCKPWRCGETRQAVPLDRASVVHPVLPESRADPGIPAPAEFLVGLVDRTPGQPWAGNAGHQPPSDFGRIKTARLAVQNTMRRICCDEHNRQDRAT
jgi:hypothetical protein